MAKLSFHELDEDRRLLMLGSRKNYGEFMRRCGGFSGNIYVFKHPSAVPSFVCAKIPKISKKVDARQAACRFLREMKFQRDLYYHQFVHWPFEFDFILDVPVAYETESPFSERAQEIKRTMKIESF